ncbi:MAG: type I DNA topoisomerase [Saprospirales bacterium]|nr:MAG: type I DNA topoisomerase [Saprospirales bacterium]
MAKNLLIVESPAKAKTIERFLGKDFKVKSSFGHIRDLDKGKNSVDVEKGFKPRYVVSPDKKKVVSELQKELKNSEQVWLATDEDREGEAISWHLCKVLNLDENTTNRIVFREITQNAIKKAVQSPGRLDLNLVEAQQARRILDRLVGFELSELLWKKVKGKLSAGRVQSVTVKLVVERERQINEFKSKNFFKLIGIFDVEGQKGEKAKLKAEFSRRLDDEDSARKILEACKDSSFSISSIEKKPLKRRPAPPFTTSTLQQEASRKLGFSVKRTMVAAQRLYEAGHITYMRTDSTVLSKTAIAAAAQEIVSTFGDKYHKARNYSGKKKLSQEAHEAIRPSYMDRHQAGSDRDQQRLYELIWKRTIASQMADAELEKTTVKIDGTKLEKDYFQATGEVLLFDGFLKVYMESKDDDDDEEKSGILPPLTKGQNLPLLRASATERFTRPPARFSEASLVKKLEELGIGRPSTYAPTISKIMEPDRGYVIKDSRDGEERKYKLIELKNGKLTEKIESEKTGAVKNRLFPTDIGMVVTDFLDKHFDEIMDYSFTADIEKQFDIIAEGKLEREKMLKDFYNDFHKLVEETMESASRETGERILGKDPKSGHSVVARITRYGPVIQIGTKEEVGEEGKPKFAGLRHDQSIETINLEDALELFKLPMELGSYKDREVVVGVGRYGPYVRWGDTFVSLPKGVDPLTVDMPVAEEVIRRKEKENEPVFHFEGKPVTKGKGRFGPFFKWDGMFVNIPRKYDPETITQQEAVELIKAKIEKEKNRYIQKWEDEKINLENGRWGPFIRFGKKSVKLPKKKDNTRYTPEEAKEFTLDQVKKFIEMEIPGAFEKKTRKKKAPAKKSAAKGKKGSRSGGGKKS